MYKKGDMLKVGRPEAVGGFEYLMFVEDAHRVHDNPLKYMGAAIAVCKEFPKDRDSQKTFCQSCRHGCHEKKYMIKYVGAFEGEAKEKSSKKKGGYSTFNQELDELIRQEKGGGSGIESGQLEREQALLRHQADVHIVSPFLMQTVDYGEDKCHGVPVEYVVLEYVRGQELRSYIAVLKNMQDQEEADRRRFDIMRQMLYAVRAYARQYSAVYNVHRDLKPENMIVYSYGEQNDFQLLKLLDFDMMVEKGNIGLEDLYMGGTSGYVHPEAYRLAGLPENPDQQFSHHWDLYAVGLIMYEIMEGNAHFQDDYYLENELEAYTLKAMDSDREYPELTRIIARLIANDGSRYENIDEVIEDYQLFLEKYYGSSWYQNFYLDHWLECRPGYERNLPFANVYCCIRSDGLKDCRQSFCVYENTVTRLIYGKNIFGSKAVREKVIQTEIGAFYYTNENVQFMPLSSQCELEAQDGVYEDDIIRYRDVEIQIEKIRYYD